MGLRSILVLTDGEYDDFGALLILSMICKNAGYKMVVVVCYRSETILNQMASDIRRLFPYAEVLMGPEDETRNGGYPMDAPNDGVKTPLFSKYPDDIRLIVGLSLLDALLMPFSHISEAPETNMQMLLACIGSRVPLFIYGGQYNLRTQTAKDLFNGWRGVHVRFDGYPAFGNRTNLYATGPYIQALQKQAQDNDPIATHILNVGRTWNEFLGAKLETEIVAWYKRYWGEGCTNPLLGSANEFIVNLLNCRWYLDDVEALLVEHGDNVTKDQWESLLLQYGAGLPQNITTATIDNPLYKLNHINAESNPRVCDSMREYIKLGKDVLADASKYQNKLRILNAMRTDPLQGCTADMFAALTVVLYDPDNPLFNQSYRLVPSTIEEQKMTAVLTPEGKKRVVTCYDTIRDTFRDEMEAMLAEAVRTNGESLPKTIPVLGKN